MIDVNGKASAKDGIYGLPFKEEHAKIVYLPIPWDVTTSYQAGTSKGPQAILMASEQIDFFDLDYIDAYQAGLFMKKESAKIKKQFDYANRKNIPYVIVVGSDEMQSGELTFKNMISGEQEKIKPNQIIEKLK